MATSYYLGIDTGGTFTDGVLLDPVSRRIVKTAKVLTTHTDLKQCIAGIFDCMTGENQDQIAMVSLSTTLATNAIVEGKRKPVALFLLGYDQTLVNKFNFQQQFGTPYYFFVAGKHSLAGVEEVPLDEEAVLAAAKAVISKVDAFAVVSYAGSRNTTHEERAAELIASISDAPVIQGHHLASDLDSIRRATTASLNASLLSHAHEFLNAVQSMMQQRGLRCPVMMVRGDGSIVKADYVRRRPVEIIHSGPATSAVGGQFLADVKAGLVIDMGGTTTDLALIVNGNVQSQSTAATVGNYHTCVKTMRVRSFGLGGDSFIRFDRYHRLTLGPDRVLPFSHLCSEFPAMWDEILRWMDEKNEVFHFGRLEAWILRKDPGNDPENHEYAEPRVQKIISILREGPCLLPRLLKKMGVVSTVQLKRDFLVNHGIIERAGLTPTDLLHVSGEYTPWDAEIANRLVQKISTLLEMDAPRFIQWARQQMTSMIAVEVVEFLTGKAVTDFHSMTGRHGLDRWLFEENLDPQNEHLTAKIQLRDPIVGIGAPAAAFLPDVARALHTEIVLPENFAVANAVGTVVGNVLAQQEGEVTAIVNGMAVEGFVARVNGTQQVFETFNEAVLFARERLIQYVTHEAISAGASEPVVECEERVVLQDLIRHFSAWAVGKPQLG